MKYFYPFLFCSILPFWTSAQTVKILFDATKGEQTGNADWVIDADQYNICVNSSGNIYTNVSCSESNPQNIPTPAASGINAGTTVGYWTGGLSAWAVECVKRGYQVETLPYNGTISYGNSGNPRDLSNYRIFVICEPNINFTAAQKTAIMNFVSNGGRLFMIADHWGSDRNFDGDESVTAFNDLMFNNGINNNNPFGMTLDSVDYSATTTNASTVPNDSMLTGPYGTVTQMKVAGSTTITIDPTKNSTVRGSFYKSSVTKNNKNILAAYARYGKGKVALYGDSSPFDDGTGDPGDVLYDGWITDAGGNHRKMIMNTTVWLATLDTFITTITPSGSTTFCAGDSVTLTATTGVSYMWSNSKTTNSITVKTGNTYYVTVTNSFGQTATASIGVTVNPLPTPTITQNGNTLSTGTYNNYTWYKDNVIIGGATAKDYVMTSSGNYKVSVTDNKGCSNISAVNFYTYTPPFPLKITPSKDTICAGDSALFTIPKGNNIVWSTGDTVKSIWVKQAGRITVTAKDSVGVSGYDTAHLAFYPTDIPTIQASGKQLSASTLQTYQWYRNDSIINGAVNNTYLVTQSGNYVVKGKNQYGCEVASAPFVMQVSEISKATSKFHFHLNNQPLVLDGLDFVPTMVLFYDVQGNLILKTAVTPESHIQLPTPTASLILIQLMNNEHQSLVKQIVNYKL